MNSQQLVAATRPLYESALSPSALGAWECNLANETLSWTDGVYDLFGLQRGSEIYRKATLDLYEERSRRDMEQHRSNSLRTGQGFALDCRIRAVNGEKRWMRLIVGVGHQHGRPIRIFGSKQDVTAEKGLWNGVSNLTRAEPPTSPAARRSLTEALRHFRQAPDREPDRIAVAIFEIDSFPAIVEHHGRAAGEDVMRCFGERLRRLFPDALAIDQTGPGAFALMLRMPCDKGYLASMLAGTRKLLCRPMPRGYLVIDFTLSIGAALLKPENYREQNDVFTEAEAALHVAGLAGGDCVRVFDGPATGLRPAAVSA
ncbi:MAG: diguanylate cyclase [Hyphomicrobiales bacterium]|nr:MAG: diguanylate cyclase [Hyphomicrobiales bacterium]